MLSPNGYLLLLLLPFYSCAQPQTYYQHINFSSKGDGLKVQLSNLISQTHTPIAYTSSSFPDTWDVIAQSDRDTADSTLVTLIYGWNDTDDILENDRTRKVNLACHTSNCTGKWNREHVYPKSLSQPKMVKNETGITTDLHNLRAAAGQMNNHRSNRFFENGTGAAHTITSDYFYPGDEWKGDVARIIMYMYIRYGARCKPEFVCKSISTYSPHADMPDILLEWNAQDPPSAFEMNRNNIIYKFQGNRNPFIDNPYLATLLWNGPRAVNSWRKIE